MVHGSWLKPVVETGSHSYQILTIYIYIYIYIYNSLINRLLMVNGSWLMGHASWLKPIIEPGAPSYQILIMHNRIFH